MVLVERWSGEWVSGEIVYVSRPLNAQISYHHATFFTFGGRETKIKKLLTTHHSPSVSFVLPISLAYKS
jgi:hypothetical protein